MQLNSILFPGPAVDMPTPMQNVVFIPRGRLREPNSFEEEKKESVDSKEEMKVGPYQEKKVAIWSCGLSKSQSYDNDRPMSANPIPNASTR